MWTRTSSLPFLWNSGIKCFSRRLLQVSEFAVRAAQLRQQRRLNSCMVGWAAAPLWWELPKSLLSFSEDSRESLRDPAVGKHTFYRWSLALWLDEHVFQLCVLLKKKKKNIHKKSRSCLFWGFEVGRWTQILWHLTSSHPSGLIPDHFCEAYNESASNIDILGTWLDQVHNEFRASDQSHLLFPTW